ncbi:hypothetical protein Tco_0990226 [Tanacetum coccineum]|uniref:Reverse transcriptase domain-containing protein n=1 Tax=Tanacetum coccineum TaxID=301880 RepID=A0ABQ5EWA2_9ASTR
MFSIKQVPRSENKKADALTKIASTSFAHLSKQVLVEELKEKSINELEVLAVVEEEGDTWMTPIYEYLTEETLTAEVNKEKAERRKSQRFTVINGVLYNKSFLRPWLRTSFKPGDLVYRSNDASRIEEVGKLGPKWEGPYEVTEALGKGAYKLRDRDGKQLP